MKLNAEVINEIVNYYKDLSESDETPLDIRQNCQCAADLNMVYRLARAVIRGLEMEQPRSETLKRMLEDDKS